MYKRSFVLSVLSIVLMTLSWTGSASTEVGYYTDNGNVFYKKGIGLFQTTPLDLQDRMDSTPVLIMVGIDLQIDTEPMRTSLSYIRTMLAKDQDANMGITTAALNFLPDKSVGTFDSIGNFSGQQLPLMSKIELLEPG